MLKASIKETNLIFLDPIIVERYSTEFIILDDLNAMDVNNNASAEEINNYYKKQDKAGLGYHYVIRKDGTIERGLPFYARGFSTNKDWKTINIVICGKFRDEELTKQQVEQTAILIANLTDKYQLPTDKDHIISKQAFVNSLSPGKHLNEMIETIIGKANWYRYQGGPESNKPITFVDELISEHFSKSEFWCHGIEQGTCHCNHSIDINPKLIELVEQLRYNIGGYPLHINSGYRCPEHNSAVGGVMDSQHILGNAADISRPDQLSFEEFKWYVTQLPFDGIGLYYAGDFIHCDVRHGGIGSQIIFYGS